MLDRNVRVLKLTRTVLYAAAGASFGSAFRELQDGMTLIGYLLLLAGVVCVVVTLRLRAYLPSEPKPSPPTAPGMPPTLSSRIVRESNGLQIQIRPDRLVYILTVAAIWIIFVMIVGMFVYGTYRTSGVQPHPESARLISVLPLLFVCIAIFTWRLLSIETIRLAPGELRYGRKFFGMGRFRRFSISGIRNLRVDARAAGALEGQDGPGLLGRGVIAFDYDHRTIRMGSGISAAEAGALVAEVAAIYPAVIGGD